MKAQALKEYILPAGQTFEGVLFTGYLLMASGLSLSRAMMSIGIGLVIAASILHYISSKSQKIIYPSYFGWLVIGVFVLAFISGIYSEDTQRWAELIRIKLPLLLFPILIAQFQQLKTSRVGIVVLVFALALCLVVLLSFGKYFVVSETPFALMATHIKNTGTVEIITKVHHIYFGLFLAFSAIGCLSLYMEKERKETFKYERICFLVLCTLNTISVHLLTSRTGFITLYAGFLFFIIHYLLTKRQYLTGLIFAALLALSPLTAYQLLPSFKERIDFTIWESKEYLVYHKLWDSSMMKRYFTWEITWDIFKAHPMTGIGIGDIRKALLTEGEKRLKNINRAEDMNEEQLLESPHCQYLENMATQGILGLLCLVAVIAYPFLKKGKPIWVYCFIFVIALSLLTESLLERQWGITFFVLVTSIGGLFSDKSASTNPSS